MAEPAEPQHFRCYSSAKIIVGDTELGAVSYTFGIYYERILVP